MTEPFRDDPSYLSELPPDLKDRRREAARRRRWRRRLVIAVVIAVAAAVIAIAAASLFKGSSDSGPATGSSTPPPASAAAPGTPAASAASKAGWAAHPGPVPILEYHAIQPPVPGAAYPQLFVPQADFQRQMQWLKDNGYEAVTLDQVEAAWFRNGELPPKPVVVSFDDGYRSQYVAAFPEMQRLGWRGVLNLVARGSDLSDADARKMVDAGWELASHTITHADLTTLDSAGLEREVTGSRRILRRRFGGSVDNFCYPAGRYDATVIAAVRRAGYVGAQSEVPGLASSSNPYVLARLEIQLSDGVSGMVGKLRDASAG
ncbi:MAG: polysaccharide deacetylase family protein [Solirubrobacterales bacterium]